MLRGIERELPRAVSLRHRLHAEPELAHGEERTAASIAAELPVACEAAAGTGRLARVEGDGGRGGEGGGERAGAIAVRAELDALPLRERTGPRSRPAARRCTRAGTTCTSPRWSPLCGRHTGCAMRCRRRCWRSSNRARRPIRRAPSSSRRARSRRLAPAAVVAAHVHPELAVGHRRARPRHRQRVVRHRRDHDRGRALARRLPPPGARPDPGDRPGGRRAARAARPSHRPVGPASLTWA